jgi:hypothetical protein
VLYLLIGMLLASQIGTLAWPVLLAAAVAHAVQANHVEVQRRYYMCWVHDRPWIKDDRPDVRGPLAWLVALYLHAGAGMSPQAARIDREVARAKGDLARLEALRALIRSESAPLLKIQRWLGPNQRAIALGLSMLLTASPMAYLIYGGVWLSVVLMASIALHARAARRMAARMAELG